MTMFETVDADVRRDQWGRPYIVPPGGGRAKAYTRATTVAGSVDDTHNLSRWSQRMVARGLSIRPDLLLRASSLGAQPPKTHPGEPGWRRDMDAVCEAASEAAASSAAATIGTAIHALTEQIDRGLELGPVPAEYLPHLDAYRQATAGLTMVAIEQLVVLDDPPAGSEPGIAGTPDRVVEVGGRRYIADLKTGLVSDLTVPKMAAQLAIYAHSEGYRVDGTRFGLDVDPSEGVIVDLDLAEARCRLWRIDLEAGWSAVRLALEVRQWRKVKGLVEPWQQPTLVPRPDPAPPVDEVLGLIVAAPDRDALTALWAANRAVWTRAHTEAAKARAQALSAS